MKKLVLFVLILCLQVLLLTSSSKAIYDPLSVPNNRVGVHILDPQEVETAAKLVNSNGGDWGYVTIPIRSNDRDYDKWRGFFIRAGQLHVIPIIRLSSYVDGDKWMAPNAFDLVDFANFLNEMPWPVKNRYLVIFNEPNHAKEWGGQVNPGEYAALLVQAKEIFKGRSEDFYLLTAGLDMSAPQNHTSADALKFYLAMSKLVPNWWKAVDGISVHAYPNPGFSASVNSQTRFGPRSYQYELNELKKNNFFPKTIFITETGSFRSEPFFKPAFTSVWTEPNIVAVTPFILFAGAGDFTGFSLLNGKYQPTPKYEEIYSLPKIAGSPLLNNEILERYKAQAVTQTTLLPKQNFNIFERIKSFFAPHKSILKIGTLEIQVEIADSEAKRRHGLSDRDTLPDNSGMLFIFDRPQPLYFHMKDMRFGLDMIWIRDGKVVEISKNIPPPSETNGVIRTVEPHQLANWTLEVPANFADSHNINVGDTVYLSR